MSSSRDHIIQSFMNKGRLANTGSARGHLEMFTDVSHISAVCTLTYFPLSSIHHVDLLHHVKSMGKRERRDEKVEGFFKKENRVYGEMLGRGNEKSRARRCGGDEDE